MIRAKFCIRTDKITSFTISGHSGLSESGTDVVCAAVSSAAYMTANTITEVLGVTAEVAVRDGYMHFSFSGSDAATDMVKGLLLHMRELSSQYPHLIKVTTEV